MNILCSYTLRNLKKNKVRTIVTIVGIILSVSMFTAVMTLDVRDFSRYRLPDGRAFEIL